MQDVADFVMEYISSDVSQCSFLHILPINPFKGCWNCCDQLADYRRHNKSWIFDEYCITLTNLHSNAANYLKSGQPVALEKSPGLRAHAELAGMPAPEVNDQDSN
jgi:hypothetical protein